MISSIKLFNRLESREREGELREPHTNEAMEQDASLGNNE